MYLIAFPLDEVLLLPFQVNVHMFMFVTARPTIVQRQRS